MSIQEEILGIKLSPTDKKELPKYHPIVNQADYEARIMKREEFDIDVQASKDFFSTISQKDVANMTDIEFRQFMLECFMHLANGVANVENRVYDNLGDPYKK